MRVNLGILPNVAEATKRQFAEEACRLFSEAVFVDESGVHTASIPFFSFFAKQLRTIPYEKTSTAFLQRLRRNGTPPIELIATEEILWLNMSIIHARLNLESGAIVGVADVSAYFNSIFGKYGRSVCAADLHHSVVEAIFL